WYGCRTSIFHSFHPSSHQVTVAAARVYEELGNSTIPLSAATVTHPSDPALSSLDRTPSPARGEGEKKGFEVRRKWVNQLLQLNGV
ncbi:MAG: hypothetical protein ACRC8S_15665, partial [Fimbriiglobus sp.]